MRSPLKRWKKILFEYGNNMYVKFKYEKLTLFCFYCGKPGHNDSFCQLRMSREEETVEMGWDLTLQAQSRRASAMNSVWFVEKLEDRDFMVADQSKERRLGHWRGHNGAAALDPTIGINLEGETRERSVQENSMDHDGEEESSDWFEGKKRAWQEISDYTEIG